MVIFKKIIDIKNYISKKRKSGIKTGFIPTMGALHSGHISLIVKAKKDKNLTICSIFLNPTQFNNPIDLKKYPISKEDDIELLINAGCDVLFLPDETEIYPDGYTTNRKYDFGYFETILEGAARPGHFRGVAQVVERLLEIIEPDVLYLGQKDFQQCKIIEQLLLQIIDPNDGDFSFRNIKIDICPTVREPDGLALSSRNRRLTDSQRAIAGTIYQCLVSIQSKQDTTNFSKVRRECEDILLSKGLVPEYVSLADAHDLRLLENYETGVLMIALIAAKVGEIRLIDNLILNQVS